jgi:hypothetical protein
MLKEKMRADVLYITVSQHDLGIFWGAKLGSPGCSWKMASRGCSALTTSPEMMEIVGKSSQQNGYYPPGFRGLFLLLDQKIASFRMFQV